MQYKISETGKSLKIETTTKPDKQQELMDEFAKCAAGTCSCPSRQYEKLSSINVMPVSTGVNIELVPRSGETIDKRDIENCLTFTSEKIEGKNSAGR